MSHVPSPSPKDWAFLQDPTSHFLRRALYEASSPSGGPDFRQSGLQQSGFSQFTESQYRDISLPLFFTNLVHTNF